MKFDIKPTVVITILAIIISSILALTYNLTGVGNIKGLSQEQLTEYAANVGIGADLKFVDKATDNKNLLGIYKNSAGEFGLQVQAKGYGGDIKLFVGISDTVKGVYVLDFPETPGIGTNVLVDNFMNQFNGKINELTVKRGGQGSDTEIVAVSGATVSSKAMVKAVNTAIETYKLLKEEM